MDIRQHLTPFGAQGRSPPRAVTAFLLCIGLHTLFKPCFYMSHKNTYEFLTDRKSSILGVWAAPGGRETFQKGGGRSPPPFWRVSRPPGAAQTLKIYDFRSAGPPVGRTPVCVPPFTYPRFAAAESRPGLGEALTE